MNSKWTAKWFSICSLIYCHLMSLNSGTNLKVNQLKLTLDTFVPHNQRGLLQEGKYVKNSMKFMLHLNITIQFTLMFIFNLFAELIDSWISAPINWIIDIFNAWKIDCWFQSILIKNPRKPTELIFVGKKYIYRK